MPAKGPARRAINARYRANHPERARASTKKYYDTHRTAIGVRTKKYQDANRSAVRARNAAWRAAHPKEFKAMQLAYDRAHPEMRRDRTQRYQARKKNAPVVEKIDRLALYARDRWICQLCFKRVSKRLKHPNPRSPSLDHVIPLAEGGDHSKQNLVLAHLGCNIAKAHRHRHPQQQRLFG